MSIILNSTKQVQLLVSVFLIHSHKLLKLWCSYISTNHSVDHAHDSLARMAYFDSVWLNPCERCLLSCICLSMSRPLNSRQLCIPQLPGWQSSVTMWKFAVMNFCFSTFFSYSSSKKNSSQSYQASWIWGTGGIQPLHQAAPNSWQRWLWRGCGGLGWGILKRTFISFIANLRGLWEFVSMQFAALDFPARRLNTAREK